MHVAQQVDGARILACTHEKTKGTLQQQVLLRRPLHLTRANPRLLGRLGARERAVAQVIEDIRHDSAHLPLGGLEFRT